MSERGIEVVGVCKRFGRHQALAPTSLSVGRGECLVLIGPSGSGKSTLLRVMNGLVRPDSGYVAIDGLEVTAAALREARHQMGYVIQEGGLFPHLSVRDNVTLLARDLGYDADRLRARTKELLELVQLDASVLSRSPLELSGGQRQRVSLMRALFLAPTFLLLDEPLGALDPILRTELRAELCALVASLGTTTVLVTHDLADAASFGGEVLVMRDGAVAQRGSLREVATHPTSEFVARFVGAERDVARLLLDAL